ncbi:MAG: formimidoylglutamate deiminase [Defluviicoccus sp.]|nr:formimidoylglutamate deiminase [Defluviicoccus sp.]MDE0383873.1 formimidoylglutamate deiminase [Defluviicoccus sp.]
MLAYAFDRVLTPEGWLAPGRIEIGGDGRIAAVGAGEGSERVGGIALPGMPNLHSHAFQRAMAGLTERAGPGADSFWTWRETMYRFVARLDPNDVEAIAAQLYCEMLKAGYTAVAEFHYLHHAPDGTPYDDLAEMAGRVTRAAERTGIALTLLPVLYDAGGFGGAPLGGAQRRFANDAERLLEIVETMHGRHGARPDFRVGLAPHSLRAAAPGSLAAALAGLNAIDAGAPVHIHVAEQTREVEDCLAWCGRRPVEWLLENHAMGPRWCLVHATHMNAEETRALAATGAVAGLCPTTEANLGDGLFPLAAWLEAGGRLGIGSDSHVSTSPVEELRWLEYGQRLAARQRNIAALPEASTGARLHAAALDGGARATARDAGAVEPGRAADIVVLDAAHPLLAGKSGDTILDSWIFAGNENLVRDVMVGGRWVVRDGRHAEENAIARAFVRTIERLAGWGAT